MHILPTTSPETWTLDDLFRFDKGVLVGGIAFNVIKIASELGSGIAVILILVGAFYYFTAFGNEEKAQKGKTIVMWAVIGIIVILLANVIVYTVTSLLK